MNKNAKVEIKAAQIAAVLEQDAVFMESALTRLNDLRANIIKREPTLLEELLQIIKSEQNSYAANESKRNALRYEIAAELQCNFDQVNISLITRHVGARTAGRLASAKSRLEALTFKLRSEYMATASLLTECARFNRQLVSALLGPKNNVTTYDSRGSQSQQVNTAMLNFQL